MQFNQWLENYETNLTLEEWMNLSEATATRYSIEVNYRSNKKEVMEAFAKIVLGYVSAAIKQDNYHVKHVFENNPIRILVSSRNWDTGEWTVCVSFNPENESFIISKGFYNRERKTISVQNSKKCDGNSAAEIAKELRNLMFDLKNKPDKFQEKLKPVPIYRKSK